MGYLVNIDNGGTFTDVCISDGERVVHAKAPTTPHDLTQCFVDVMLAASEQLYGEEDFGRLIHETDYLRYATTSGTNAVVERKGTPVALIVEKGEEQSLYGVAEALAESGLWLAMVPDEASSISVDPSGAVDPTELAAVVNSLVADGAKRLVIALRSDSAERAVKDELLERYPRHLLGAVPFLVSHELVKDPDHGRRMLTAVVNSYLHPGMEHFLYGAEGVCKRNHLRRPLLIYRNDGGSARVAKTTALKTWGSGPRGGVEAAANYARLYGCETLVAMDIGGTTTDLSVISQDGTRLRSRGEIDGLTTSFPLPDLRSFGLGGSSVVRRTEGELQIGPDSVGAAPGPACFGRGGTEATLTDALLVAGLLDPESHLGGDLQLDRRRAEDALVSKLGTGAEESAEALALAVIHHFEARAGSHAKALLQATGRNAETAALLAYGGAGPVICCGIAEQAGLTRAIVPGLSAVFSAFGLGFGDISHRLEGRVEDAPPASLAKDLEAQARRVMYGEGVDPDACHYSTFAVGERNGNLVEEPVPEDAVAGTTLTTSATFSLPRMQLTPDEIDCNSDAPASGRVETALDGALDLYAENAIEAGLRLTGPALLRGDHLTCMIPSGWSARTSANRDLILEVSS